ncbi:Histone acetyltransferase GCN5 [Gracilariopsis chorda]|uniref:Histone acetyltransferase GCN5 n=1 Tax=Gracilariopsis chorda TaxID=448386 RepID=A0A2V3ITY5_9FLOR|nr:Histone acetyltransferase GCN5 [Gracilariopsis chorda]|eukprot:PXF45563.1 Histone acetyltransferase GCN5 [Gracilariopsis chorda]
MERRAHCAWMAWQLGSFVHTAGPALRRSTKRVPRVVFVSMEALRPLRVPTRVLGDLKKQLKKRGNNLLGKVSYCDGYWMFLQHVDFVAINGYAEVFAHPMELSICHYNLAMGVYRMLMKLRADLDLIWYNCCTFNANDSIYFKEAMCSRQFLNCPAFANRLLSLSERRVRVKLTPVGNS